MQAAIKEQRWQKLNYLARRGSGYLLAIPEVNRLQTSIEDTQLLHRIASRDREAFSQFYDRYAAVLYSMTIRILNDPDEASDVLQDVFVQVWEKCGSFNPDLGKPFSWVLTLTRNRAIDRLRARKRQYRFVEELSHEVAEGSPPNLHEQTLSHEEAVLIRSAVATLPVEQRQAIEMAFLGGMTQHEISQSLGQPLGTVKARIRRGMLKLRDELKGLL